MNSDFPVVWRFLLSSAALGTIPLILGLAPQVLQSAVRAGWCCCDPHWGSVKGGQHQCTNQCYQLGSSALSSCRSPALVCSPQVFVCSWHCTTLLYQQCCDSRVSSTSAAGQLVTSPSWETRLWHLQEFIPSPRLHNWVLGAPRRELSCLFPWRNCYSLHSWMKLGVVFLRGCKFHKEASPNSGSRKSWFKLRCWSSLDWNAGEGVMSETAPLCSCLMVVIWNCINME